MAFPKKNPQCLPDQLFQTHNETQRLEVAQESKALEEACLSSHPAMSDNLKEAPAGGILSTSESAQGFCSSSIVTTVYSSGKYGEGCISEVKEGNTLEADPDPKNVPINAPDENMTSLVNFLLLKYQMNEIITKAEMLIVSKGYEDHFIETFLRTCMCMEIIFGLDPKEVDLTNHCYSIFIKMGLTYDGMLHDKKGMPKTGILILTLAVIFMKGKWSTEEKNWQVLKVMGVYSGRKHHIFGEPRKLITKYFVKEEYLKYQQVPNSDPKQFEFLWGPRAHAEITKMQVLEFMARVHGIDTSCFPSQYEDTLQDEENRVQARISARAVLTSMATTHSMAKPHSSCHT